MAEAGGGLALGSIPALPEGIEEMDLEERVEEILKTFKEMQDYVKDRYAQMQEPWLFAFYPTLFMGLILLGVLFFVYRKLRGIYRRYKDTYNVIDADDGKNADAKQVKMWKWKLLYGEHGIFFAMLAIVKIFIELGFFVYLLYWIKLILLGSGQIGLDYTKPKEHLRILKGVKNKILSKMRRSEPGTPSAVVTVPSAGVGTA